MSAHLSCFWARRFFFSPPFCLGLITGGSLALMFGAVVPCGLGKGTDSFSACPRALLVWG